MIALIIASLLVNNPEKIALNPQYYMKKLKTL